MRGGICGAIHNNSFQKGSGNAEEGNCGGNANPAAPGGAIGGEGEMEYIRHGGMLQQHHALATHNNLKQIMHEATGACIVFLYNRVGR